MSNLWDCENCDFLKWLDEEWKFGEQGAFCRAFVLTSKPDKLVAWLVGLEFQKKIKIRLLVKIIEKPNV